MFQQFENLFAKKGDTDEGQPVAEEDPEISLLPSTAPSALPPSEEWPHRPLLLLESSAHTTSKKHGSLPMNGVPCEFETELFKGKMMFRSRNLPEAASYFQGKKRLSSVVITGQFKSCLKAEEVQTGQEFANSVSKPPAIVSKPVIGFFRLLAPLLKIFVGANEFYSHSPLIQTVQCLYVSDEKVELKPDTIVEENFTLNALGESMTAVERKKYFSTAAKLKDIEFDPRKWYTFDFYNDKMDLENFALLVLGKEFALDGYVNHQPLRILSRVFKPGAPKDLYLWNFEVWHENLVKEEEEEEGSS